MLKKFFSLLLTALVLLAFSIQLTAFADSFSASEGTLRYFDFEIENPTYYYYGNGNMYEFGSPYISNITGYSGLRLYRINNEGSQLYGIVNSEDEARGKAAKMAFGGYGGGLGVTGSYTARKLYMYSSYVKADPESTRASRKVALLPLFDNGYGALSGTQMFVCNPATKEWVEQSAANSDQFTARPEGLFYTVDKTNTAWERIDRVFYMTADSKSPIGLSYDGVWNAAGMGAFIDDIYVGALFSADGDDTVDVTGKESVNAQYSVSAKLSEYNSLISEVTWSLGADYTGVAVSDGVLTVTKNAPSQTVTLNASITTTAQTRETVSKTIAIVNGGPEKYESTVGTLANYDFEIENLIYLNAQGQPVKEGEQIFSIKNVNLYPFRAAYNGNEFQGLNSDFAYSGTKSILVKQGYAGGLYASVITKPHTLYVYSMRANSTADTQTKSLKLADSKSDSNGNSLKVYSPDFSETNNGIYYTGGGNSAWTLSSDNAGKWEKVERVFYSDTDENVSRNLHFTAPTGTGNENGIYKFYMDDLYIGRVFTDISVDSEIIIPKNGDMVQSCEVVVLNPNYAGFNKGVKWSVSEADGVSIDENSGALTVSPSAKMQTITVTAEITTDIGTETLSKDVFLNSNPANIWAVDSLGNKISSVSESFSYKIKLNYDDTASYIAVAGLFDKNGTQLKEVLSFRNVEIENGEALLDIAIPEAYELKDVSVTLMLLDGNLKPMAFKYNLY